ncbi:hypothetical protein [Polaribacter staleyi]|uniref:hypothetical protein n=1 Tax=Polaribacter staleyi TaxID=2022337 RepID=UPI0031BAA3DB
MNDLENKVKKWILKNGYPFEMKVANFFKKADFKVSQSVLYRDEDSSKLRELDIISYSNTVINNVWFNFTFVVECKKSTDKPWVVFKNDNLHNPQLERYKPFTTRNAEILLNKTKVLKENKFELLFPNLFEAGFNLVTSLGQTKDLAYSSTTSLLKACKYLTEKFNESKSRSCNIYIPLIIIEGILYESFLDKKDDLELIEVDYSSILNTKVFSEGDSNIITIVSSKNLENFIDRVKEDTLLFFKTYKKEIEEVSLSNPTSIKVKSISI